jgi:hypothetical protein
MVEIAKKNVKTLLTEQILQDIEGIPLVHLITLQSMIEGFKLNIAMTPIIPENQMNWHDLLEALQLKKQTKTIQQVPHVPPKHDKQALFRAFERAQQKGVFKNIPNAVEWQRNLRNG